VGRDESITYEKLARMLRMMKEVLSHHPMLNDEIIPTEPEGSSSRSFQNMTDFHPRLMVKMCENV
jgi:hypothetical protein